MKLKCIIIEDQPPAQRILKKYIQDLSTLELMGVFSDATDAIGFLSDHQVDLIFLDIHLPKISGIDFLKAMSDCPPVVLTTAFSDYALESYEFNVIDYLLKPFSFQRFVKAVSKVPKKTAITELIVGKEDHLSKKEIFIKSGHEHIKIALDKILFIKSDTDYTEIHLNETKYLSVEPLRHWLETLDAQKFVQIHKSYLINVSKINKVAGNQVFLTGENILPIGRAYKEYFMKNYVR